MQRQLLDIADRIPNDILLNLLKSFAQILTREPEPTPRTPFIRAFAKIRDDSAQKQFSAIIEEDEDNHVIPHEENFYVAFNGNDFSDGDDDRNECSFNYKVANVVTQEVIYSMNGNEHEQSDDQESTSAAAAIVDSNSNNEETNGDQMNDNRVDNEAAVDVEENLLNENQHDAMIENGEESSGNGSDAIDEGIEVEMPKLMESDDTSSDVATREVESAFEEINGHVETAAAENENGIDEIMSEEKPQDDFEPIQKVSLDDIQREIQEMQMFIRHKNVQEARAAAIVNHEIRNSKNIIEDAFKVDVCLNLKKKHEKSGEHQHKKHSKSKAIVANYLNGKAKEYLPKERQYLPKERPLFDPAVPNTPEDFMKEKSVTEQIKKKKQKIKNLDVNWQKLVDSQKKVYK